MPSKKHGGAAPKPEYLINTVTYADLVREQVEYLLQHQASGCMQLGCPACSRMKDLYDLALKPFKLGMCRERHHNNGPCDCEKWERIFKEKFEDPLYYAVRYPSRPSSLTEPKPRRAIPKGAHRFLLEQ